MNKDQANRALELGLLVRLNWWSPGAFHRLDLGTNQRRTHTGLYVTGDTVGADSDDWQIYHEAGDTFTGEQATFLLLEAGERVGWTHGEMSSWWEVCGDGIIDNNGGQFDDPGGFTPAFGPYRIIPRGETETAGGNW